MNVRTIEEIRNEFLPKVVKLGVEQIIELAAERYNYDINGNKANALREEMLETNITDANLLIDLIIEDWNESEGKETALETYERIVEEMNEGMEQDHMMKSIVGLYANQALFYERVDVTPDEAKEELN